MPSAELFVDLIDQRETHLDELREVAVKSKSDGLNGYVTHVSGAPLSGVPPKPEVVWA